MEDKSSYQADKSAFGRKKGQDWERDVITRLAMASLTEQRRTRRWGVFFKFLIFVYLFGVVALYWPSDLKTPGLDEKHTALVELEGVISSDTEASADHVVTGLRDAFEDKDTKAVILRINSPGGSPVQSAYINAEITRLRGEYPDIPLYAVIVDICASGGYYVAAAADAIYANPSSIVGSIGVIMNGFGFVDSLDKLGMERRLLTAGDHKGLLDPFSPVDDEELSHVKELLDDIHRQFIKVVKEGRGDKLKDDERLFSGLIWTGDQAKELGLVDEFGSASYVAREVVGEEKLVDFTPKTDWLERFAERMGASMAQSLATYFGARGPTLE